MTIYTTKPQQPLEPSVRRYDAMGLPTKDQRLNENNLQLFLNALAAQLTAWTSYTPTITAGSGTFTSVSATGRYMQIGKTVFVQMVITETAIGTAGSYVIATLPTTAKSAAILPGRENGATGKMLQGAISANTAVAFIIFYDNTAPITNGYVLNLSGVYEST